MPIISASGCSGCALGQSAFAGFEVTRHPIVARLAEAGRVSGQTSRRHADNDTQAGDLGQQRNECHPSRAAIKLSLESWLLGAGLTHDHHRQSRVFDDTCGNAAQRGASDTGTPMRPHDDEDTVIP
jgi:hypothetical protein